MANHPLVAPCFRKVRHPAGHQVKHHGALGNPLCIELRQALAKALIQVMNEAWFGVKQQIIGTVPFAAL